MTAIGFVGLGNMGGPMAANLVKAGHAVTGYDTSAAALERFAAAGGKAASSTAEAAAAGEVVITMLPAGAHVRAVYTGEGRLLESARPGTLLIDSSTIDVETARAVAKAAAGRGFGMLDAPVSGGVGGAAAATLTFMVGGEAKDFARAQPVLAAMGKTIVHAGPSGSGQAAKICNNMMLGISMIGVCEAFALAEKLGLDAQKLFDISAKSSGQCWSLTTYCPVPGPVPSSPANRDYQPGFTAEMMLKDLRLAQQAAQTAGAATPLGANAAALYALMVNGGAGAKDFSAIFRFLSGQRG
ncbi:MAG TPA: 3-hydroxyisobutyrate dehydrogenase [Stellaceae bacterium]|nr:3-hydroxyisobutyrate dehydrogenase [Stellaceae bacterium]